MPNWVIFLINLSHLKPEISLSSYDFYRKAELLIPLNVRFLSAEKVNSLLTPPQIDDIVYIVWKS